MRYSWMYRFKCLLLDKTLIFWSLLFPLILSTFFAVALKPALTDQELKTIPVAVVEKNLEYDPFKIVLDQVSKMDNPLLKITKVESKEAALKLMDKEKVDGIITSSSDLIVRDNNVNATILQEFMNSYLQKQAMMAKLVEQGASPQIIMENFLKDTTFIKDTENSSAQLFAVSFYTIIGMVALMGGYWGQRSICDLRADYSAKGARVSVAPTHHMRILISDIIMDTVLHYGIILILMAYIVFVLGIDFGNQIGMVLLTAFLGTLAGISSGMFFTCYVSKDQNFSNMLVTAFSLTCSFFAGMMSVQVKYMVQINLPWLAKINPANMITDGLYSIYYYGGGERYIANMISLVIFSLICFICAYVKLRRKKYASI